MVQVTQSNLDDFVILITTYLSQEGVDAHKINIALKASAAKYRTSGLSENDSSADPFEVALLRALD